MITVMDNGALAQLRAIFRNERPAGGSDLTLRLYTNVLEITDILEAGDFTEASGGGYAAKALVNGTDWTCSVVSGVARAIYPDQTWTFTGPLDGGASIRGYYVVNADNVVEWAEPISPVLTPQNNGDELVIPPTYRASKGTPA